MIRHKILNFNLFNSIILAGIIQGLILAGVVLFSKRYDSAGVKWLGWLILAFSLNNLQYWLMDTGTVSRGVFFRYIFFPAQLLLAPTLLLYGISLLQPEKKLHRKMYVAFLPFAIGLFGSTVYKTIMLLEIGNSATNRFFGFTTGLLELFAVIFSFSVIVYLLGRIRKEKRDASVLKWFRNILISLLCLTPIWLAMTFLDFVFRWYGGWYFIWISTSAMIYWLGHVGVYQYGISEERRKIRSFSIAHRPQPVPEAKPASVNEHILSLKNLVVTQRKFLDPNLTLESAAAQIGLSKTHLSRIVNSELNTGFPDYVNNLRVEQAKIYLNHPDFANYTLVAIGLEAGFSSKTTFNQAFRKFTGMTPSEYRNSQIRNEIRIA